MRKFFCHSILFFCCVFVNACASYPSHISSHSEQKREDQIGESTEFQITSKPKSEATSGLLPCALSGTLLRPMQESGKQAQENSKARALAVFIHGSGPANRDGSTPSGHAPYRDIAVALQQMGVASFRFDKRVITPGCKENVIANITQYSVWDEINDVENVMNTLASRKEFHHVPLILIGHSQGVSFATEIIARRSTLKPPSLLIALAGLGKYPIDNTLLRQLKQARETSNLPESERQAQLQLIQEAESYFNRVRMSHSEPSDCLFGACFLYWKDWIEISDRAVQTAADSNIPTLLLQGSKDKNITHEDFHTLAAIFEKTPGSKSQFVEGVNHMLALEEPQPVSHSTSSVSKQIIKHIQEFLNENLAPSL